MSFIYKLKQLFYLSINPKLLKILLSMNSSGYLFDIGWINSFNKKTPLDKNNKPLPWVTYSFIDFIDNRINKSLNIFEYGSGNSTFYYSKKAKSVDSIEHDINWYEKLKKKLPNNANIFYTELDKGGKYSKYPEFLKRKFDIIIVDGRDRVNCMINSINYISDNGIIILDDSERKEYQKGIDKLLKQGFKKLDFWGISPGLFYKKNNCFNI